jgi:hypothetical protein
MLIKGCECSIVIKTAHCEMDIPYSEETLREAVSILQEEAAIEGDSVCRGIKKAVGVRGCVVSPLTLATAPLLLYFAMGSIGKPVFISETRNLYKCQLSLLPLEDTDRFDLVQDRGNERILYEGCGVTKFELRFLRGEAVKLKLDICGEHSPRIYPYTEKIEREQGERFFGDLITYRINGKEYRNIYGVTLSCKKEGSTKTEIWIRRILEYGEELPNSIDEMVITAQLLRDKYENRYYGMFRITLKRLVFVSDETIVESADAVIGSVKFYVFGTVETDVFTSTEEFSA